MFCLYILCLLKLFCEKHGLDHVVLCHFCVKEQTYLSSLKLSRDNALMW